MARINERVRFGPQQQGWLPSGIIFSICSCNVTPQLQIRIPLGSSLSYDRPWHTNRPRPIRERGKRKNQREIAEEEVRLSLAEVALSGGVSTTAGVG